MKQIIIFILAISVLRCVNAGVLNCPAGFAPVTGFAQNFVTDARLNNAIITVLETGNIYKTDSKGRFGFCQKIGRQITLTLKKNGYHLVQSATYHVPEVHVFTHHIKSIENHSD